MSSLSNRVCDWVVYFGIGLLVVSLIVAYAEYSAPSSEFPERAVWLSTITLIVFGYTVKAFRRVWRKPMFWLVCSAFLGVHVLGFWFLLSKMQSHFILMTSLFAGPEVLVLCFSIDLILGTH